LAVFLLKSKADRKISLILLAGLFFFCSAKATEIDPFASEVPPEKFGMPSSSVPPKDASKLLLKTAKPATGKKKADKSANKPTKKSTPPPPPTPQLARPGGDEFRLTIGLESVLSAAYVKSAVDFAELTSDQKMLPHLVFSEQLYPNLKLSNGRSFLLNARPRISLLTQRAKKTNTRDQIESRFSAEFSEIYTTLSPTANLSISAGKQNFQWGMGDMGSPSNWIFRPSKLAESLLSTPQSAVETRDLVRLNWSSGQFFNLVTMAEYEAQPQSMPKLYSGRRMLVKPEFSWNNGASFIGFVLAGAEKQRFPFFGEYLSYNFNDALTAYIDAAQLKGSDMLRPVSATVPTQFGEMKVMVFDQNELQDDSINHEILLGLRYTFENGAELKIENLYKSSGLSAAEVDKVQIIEKTTPMLLPYYFEPGVEYRSQDVLLFAFRRNGFGPKKKLSILLRYLKPIADSSGAALMYSESAVSDNGLVFLGVGGYHGATLSQSSLPQRFALTLGYKYVW